MHDASNPIEALLDFIDFGIILANTEGTVVAANAVARETAASWGLLRFSAEAPDGPPALCHASIIEAAGSVSGPPRTKPHTIAEVILRHAHRKDSLLVTAVSLPVNGRASDALLRASCALFFRNSADGSPARARAALSALGFTPAESELAEALLEGLSIDECCARLGRTRNTLRSRMKAMLAKAGVHRQGQLIALVLKSVPQIRIADGVVPRQVFEWHVEGTACPAKAAGAKESTNTGGEDEEKPGG